MTPHPRGRCRAIALVGLCWLVGSAGCQEPAAQPQPAPAVLRSKASAEEQAGQFAAAANTFLQLVAAEPDRPEWAVAAGRCLGRASRFNDAMDLLEQKRKQFPAVLDLPAMLARTYLLKAESEPGAINPESWYADAASLAETVLAADPGHLEAALILAQARYQLGQWDAAVGTAEAAARRHPEHPGPHILLGRIALERYRQLRRDYDAAKADGQSGAGLLPQIQAERDHAVAAFLRAVAIDPKRPFPHQALGNLAASDGKIDVALQYYIAAMVVDPDAAVDHAWIEHNTTLEQRLATYQSALARYRALPAPAPHKVALLQWYVARALYDGQRWAEAVPAFERVLADNAAFVNAHYYAALAAWWQDQHDLAEAHAAAYARAGAPAFADVVRALPNDLRAQVGTILKFLGDRAFQQQRLEHSRDLNHVVACLKDTADAWNNYAFLCRETGNFADSYAAYQQALEKEPESPQLLNDAAVILQYHLPSAENLAKARGMYERALALAAKVLADTGAGKDERQRAESAQHDAEQNLAKLGK
ncbi:MAG TPA: tetratricopeptide repeat protein [Planctomycetota bacterium]|nr:tetratricopeptide repeat protein [Planctomycetota bacterium]